jgi:hypothetical protein
VTTIAEKNALKALLLTDTEFKKTSKLFEGRAVGSDGKPIAGTWYLTMQVGSDDDVQDRATGGQVVRDASVTFQCSGSTPEQAQWVSERLDGVLRPFRRGVRLVVPNTRTDPLNTRTGPSEARLRVNPVQIDSDVSPPMWFQTVEYSFRSQPAPTT